MLDGTKIKKYSTIYDLLSDLNEHKLCSEIKNKLKKKGYAVAVVRDKYKFKWVGVE